MRRPRADQRAQTGRRAELTARHYLERQGLSCVDSNVRCRYGEIDLVMQDAELIVFVEVRYRCASNPVDAIASIDSNKQRKLARTAAWYLCRRPGAQANAVRFDVVALDGRSDSEYALQWIKDAFRPGA